MTWIWSEKGKWRDVSKLWEHQEIPSHSIIDVCRQNGKWILFTEYVSPNNTETKGNLFLKNIWSQCSRSPKSVLLNLQLPPWHFLKIESGFLFYEIQLPNNHKFCEHWIWKRLFFLSLRDSAFLSFSFMIDSGCHLGCVIGFYPKRGDLTGYVKAARNSIPAPI